MKKGIGMIVALLLTATIFSQKISLDLAGIRQMHHETNGMNVAGFYHFTQHLSGGLEVNRFFPVTRIIHGEEVNISAWDIEFNFHYSVPLDKHWNIYPITGISHTSEKEENTINAESHYSRFWSVNTGAGLSWQWKKWIPHVEYTFTWGHLNQQFLLAGLSYELEWGNAKHK